jgi:transposase-like protein
VKTDNDSFMKDLAEAKRYFSNPGVCLKLVASARWPNGPVCPRCASQRLSFLDSRQLWKCLSCKKQFSVKVGTIFEDSAIGLDKWLTALWLIANCKTDGFSSYEVARILGVTQRTAWFMFHRIHCAAPAWLEFEADEKTQREREFEHSSHERVAPGPETVDDTSAHQTIDHAVADGGDSVIASRVKNFWSRLKRPF